MALHSNHHRGLIRSYLCCPARSGSAISARIFTRLMARKRIRKRKCLVCRHRVSVMYDVHKDNKILGFDSNYDGLISTISVLHFVYAYLSCPRPSLVRSHTMAPSLVALPTEQSKTTSKFPSNASNREYAESLDSADPLKSFRNKFIIPSKANLKTTRLAKPGQFNLPLIMTNRGF